MATWWMVAIAAAAGGQSDTGTPPKPIGEVGQWFGPAAYPPAAMHAGEHGRAVTRLTIDPRGRVTDCAVTESSGSATLDAETCRIAHDRIGFLPARDAGGQPVASTYRLPVRWVLPAGGGGNGLPNFSRITTVTIGTDGAVEACEAVPAYRGPGLGPCGTYPPGRKMMPPPQRDGRPVKAHVVISTDVATTLDP